MSDDTELVRAARRDRAGFARLYRRWVGDVYRYCLSHTGDAAAAEDLTTQVFLDVLQALPRYVERGSFGGWLFTIARRRWVDFVRREPASVPIDDLPLVDRAERDPLAAALDAERIRQLQRLLETLEPDDQDLLRLRFAAGLTFSEIGQTLGRSEGACKMALGRLLERLRAQWPGGDHDA